MNDVGKLGDVSEFDLKAKKVLGRVSVQWAQQARNETLDVAETLVVTKQVSECSVDSAELFALCL